MCAAKLKLNRWETLIGCHTVGVVMGGAWNGHSQGFPHEGVGAKKFGMSLEIREIKLLGRDIPRFCWDVPAVPAKFEKYKVNLQRLAPRKSYFHLFQAPISNFRARENIIPYPQPFHTPTRPPPN